MISLIAKGLEDGQTQSAWRRNLQYVYYVCAVLSIMALWIYGHRSSSQWTVCITFDWQEMGMGVGCSQVRTVSIPVTFSILKWSFWYQKDLLRTKITFLVSYWTFWYQNDLSSAKMTFCVSMTFRVPKWPF